MVRLIESWIHGQQFPSAPYQQDFLGVLASDELLPVQCREVATVLRPVAGSEGESIRDWDRLRGYLLSHLKMEPAEWDLRPPADTILSTDAPRPPAVDGFPPPEINASVAPLERVGVFLESIRSPFNVGSMMRTAASFGVRRLGSSGDSPAFAHPRVTRSAMGSAASLELYRGTVDEFCAACGTETIVALETGGESVADVVMPDEAVLVVGSEELGISPQLLDRATMRLSIPLPGTKASLNVGVALGIALAAWAGMIAT